MASRRTCAIFSERSAWNGKSRISSIFRTPQEQGLLGNLSARVTSASIIARRVNTAFMSYCWAPIDLPDVFFDFHSTVDVQIHRVTLFYDFGVPEHLQCLKLTWDDQNNPQYPSILFPSAQPPFVVFHVCVLSALACTCRPADGGRVICSTAFQHGWLL